MKKRKAKSPRPLAPTEIASHFVQGSVVAGLLTAIQDRAAESPSSLTVARRAVQGGFALAAGVATARSLRQQDYLSALLALAGGTAGVIAAETLLAPETLQSLKHQDFKEVEIG